MNLPLTGIVPPMITPLRDRDELDVPGLERLIERILAAPGEDDAVAGLAEPDRDGAPDARARAGDQRDLGLSQ